MAKDVFDPSYWAEPGSHKRVEIEGDRVRVEGSGNAVAELDTRYRRVAWATSLPPELEPRVAAERSKYDHWADSQGDQVVTSPLDPAAKGRHWWDYPLYTNSAVEETLRRCPRLRDLSGMRILDIGGSVKDSWRFVWHGDAASVDHIEVSGNSQRLAFSRLATKFSARSGFVERFTFHTTPAEQLPFRDCAFDLVFSRATIHHTQRPEVFREIRRVLRSGGLFWMIEPRLLGPLHVAMRLSRVVRQVDRGTDDPLQNYEVEQLARIMPIDSLQGSGLLEPIVPKVLTNASAPLGRFVQRMDRALSATPLGARAARHISVVTHRE